MTSVRLALQTALVVAMAAFVSVSDYVRARATGAAARESGPTGYRPASQDPRSSRSDTGRTLRHEIGYGSMSLRRASAAGTASVQHKLYDPGIDIGRQRAPVAVQTLGGRVNGIIGQAKTTLNAPVPFARLILRDPATGRVEARAVADDKGHFTFLDVLPSGYVVELIGPNDSVFATSDVVAVGVGELREALVTLADTRQALGTFGTLRPAAEEPVRMAAQTGITAVTAPSRGVSPQR